jgi:tetratricopeptide (TPR) repeat protein
MTSTRFTSLLTVLVVLGGCSPRASDSSAVRRGDEAFALGNYDEALAEYRLAIRQGTDAPEVTARVAHTYTIMNRVDDAATYYLDAVARDSSLADQAVADLMHVAQEAWANGDRFAMATAVENALELRPGVGVGEMALPLARHYFENGQYDRALPFYQKALAEVSDSLPEIVFEVGVAHDEIGDCEHALVFFERFRAMTRPWEWGEVNWYIGRCAFEIAQGLRDRTASSSGEQADEQLEEALQLVDRTIEVGEPRNILAQAWFEKGEILADLGRCEEAMDAYAQVRYFDQGAALTDRAQARFDEIYFGRGLEGLRDGRCR